MKNYVITLEHEIFETVTTPGRTTKNNLFHDVSNKKWEAQKQLLKIAESFFTKQSSTQNQQTSNRCLGPGLSAKRNIDFPVGNPPRFALMAISEFIHCQRSHIQLDIFAKYSF